MSQTITKTYRGRSVEALAPQIRAELGANAVVLARREGVEGGVGGFFRRAFVEVEAEGAPPAAVSTDGLHTMLRDASKFAHELTRARETPAAHLYGPQPNYEPAPASFVPAPAPDPVAAAPAPAPAVTSPAPAVVAPEPEPVAAAPAPVQPVPAQATVAAAPIEPAPAAVATEAAAPAAAATITQLLTDAGLPHALAAEVVDEALLHGLVFAGGRQLKTLVRAALADRIPVMGAVGAGPRTVVVAGGAGKDRVAERLAAAYAAGGRVRVRALQPGDSALRDRFDGLTVVAAPALRVRDTAGITTLAGQLEGLDAEVHLAVPATLSSAAVADLLAAMRPLGPTHAVLAEADETSAPGAAIARVALAGLPLSYVDGDEGLAPAVAADVVRRLV